MKKDALAVRMKQWLTKRGRGRKWVAVQFMLAVKNIRKTAMPGSPQMQQVVVGRALGDRADKQCFFVEMDVPWIIGPKWDWRKVAKERLNTFLDEQCICEAKESQVKVCEYHERLRIEWQHTDAMMEKFTGEVARAEHLTQRIQGAVMPRRILNWDFPWCRHDTERNCIVCEICGFVEEPYPENSSYRNIFIQEHSKCGYPDSGYLKSMAECNLVTYGDGQREVGGMIQKLEEERAELRVLFAYAAERFTDYLPERMRPDEFVKFIRERLAKVTA